MRGNELKPTTRRAPVRVAGNHRTSTQIEGELAYLNRVLDTLERSPFDVNETAVGQKANM